MFTDKAEDISGDLRAFEKSREKVREGVSLYETKVESE